VTVIGTIAGTVILSSAVVTLVTPGSAASFVDWTPCPADGPLLAFGVNDVDIDRPDGEGRSEQDAENRAVGHVRIREGETHVEPVTLTTRNQVDVEVIHILPGRSTARDDHVHAVRARHLTNGRRELHGHVEEVRPQLPREVEESLEVLPRHDKNVACVHRLNVHERNGVAVLVAHRNFGRAVDDVAEDAVSGAGDHGALLPSLRAKRADRVP
jgi:hypothetical protein